MEAGGRPTLLEDGLGTAGVGSDLDEDNGGRAAILGGGGGGPSSKKPLMLSMSASNRNRDISSPSISSSLLLCSVSADICLYLSCVWTVRPDYTTSSQSPPFPIADVSK